MIATALGAEYLSQTRRCRSGRLAAKKLLDIRFSSCFLRIRKTEKANLDEMRGLLPVSALRFQPSVFSREFATLNAMRWFGSSGCLSVPQAKVFTCLPPMMAGSCFIPPLKIRIRCSS